jgi:hypothetical protein
MSIIQLTVLNIGKKRRIRRRRIVPTRRVRRDKKRRIRRDE